MSQSGKAVNALAKRRAQQLPKTEEECADALADTLIVTRLTNAPENES